MKPIFYGEVLQMNLAPVRRSPFYPQGESRPECLRTARSHHRYVKIADVGDPTERRLFCLDPQNRAVIGADNSSPQKLFQQQEASETGQFETKSKPFRRPPRNMTTVASQHWCVTRRLRLRTVSIDPNPSSEYPSF